MGFERRDAAGEGGMVRYFGKTVGFCCLISGTILAVFQQHCIFLGFPLLVNWDQFEGKEVKAVWDH